MRCKNNYNPDLEYLVVLPEVTVDDDILMAIEIEKFEEYKFEYKKIEMAHMEMQRLCDIEVKVFNELFLENEIDLLDVLDLDLAYPLSV